MSKIRRSLAYSFAGSYIALPLQLVGTMVISRLLTPVETGVFAVAAVFAAIASSFRDFGVAEYLIQEKELNHEKIRAALTVNIGMSWIMGLLLFFAAPLAARFYGTPGIAEVMQVQAFNFLLIPFGAVTMAFFRRELDFRPQFIASLLSNLATFIVGTACALQGLGYMSLAWSSLAGVIVSVGCSIWFRPVHFPMWPGLKGIGSVVRFGKFASGIYLFGQIGRGAPAMIIGRTQDIAGVALFSRASGLVEIFSAAVMRSVMPVCLPYFAQSSREKGGLPKGYLLNMSYLTVIGWPFLAVMTTLAYAAVRLVYGPQWMASVPLAQILCVVGAIELVHCSAKEALMAGGAVEQSNTLQIVIQFSRIVSVFACIPFGLPGACWGLLLAAVVGAAYSQFMLSRVIGLHVQDVLKACAPSLFITLLSVAPVATWVMLVGLNDNNYVGLSVGGGALTILAWLLAIRHLHHPIWTEVHKLSRKISLKFEACQS